MATNETKTSSNRHKKKFEIKKKKKFKKSKYNKNSKPKGKYDRLQQPISHP